MSNASLIVLKKNGFYGSRFPIENDNVYKFGPGIDCHLRFNVNKDVKTNFCTISTKKTGIAKIKKLSSFPILLNNKEITSPKNLQNGDVIKIGPKKFRWDSEMKQSDMTSVSLQTKTPNSNTKKMSFAAVRRRSTRKSVNAETLSTWEETNENTVSSKAETDNEKYTISNSPTKPSQSTDDAMQMSCSKTGTHSLKTPDNKRTPRVPIKAKTLSRIPIARENIESTMCTEIIKTPIIASTPLITPNIKAIKSARKKSASMRKSSDNMMQAKKWKISDMPDDTVKSITPELIGVEETASEKENSVRVSSDVLFDKQEETPKLRTSCVNKKIITNKSHTELKKVSKKLRRGSLPAETEIDSPMIVKLTISAKTVAKDDLSTISQCESPSVTSLRRMNNKSPTNLPTSNSKEETLFIDSPPRRRSVRRESNVSLNNIDSEKKDQTRELFPASRRSLHTENRVRSPQVNESLNISNTKTISQTVTSQSETLLLKSELEEILHSSTKKTEYIENLLQSDLQNSSTLHKQSLFTSAKKSAQKDPSTVAAYDILSSRKSLRKEKQLLDSSASGLSADNLVNDNNLLNISQPYISLTRSYRKETNLMDATVNNSSSSSRNSMRKSSHLLNISQNVSGVGLLNDDLIDFQYSDCELDNILTKSESMKDAIVESDEESCPIPEVTSAKKPKVQKSPLNDLSDVKGVRTLMKTPGRKAKTPKNDLTDVRGVKRLLDPKDPKSPRNDLTNVAGVKTLMKTPSRKTKTPKNDLSEVPGVKKLFSSPKMQNSPMNDLRDVKGVKRLLKTPGRVQNAPKNDLSNVRGIKRLMNPLKNSKSPENDLTKVEGVKSLFKSPRVQNSPNNDLSNVKGVKTLLKTPGRKQKTPKNDLTNVAGVKQLFEPKLLKSPENDLSDVRGVKQLFKRNNLPRNDLRNVEDIRNLFVTAEELNKSSDLEEVRKTTKFNSMDDLFNELKYENEQTDSPLSHLRKTPLKTYERKAMSLSPVKRDAINLNMKSRYSERMIHGPTAHVQKWIEEQKALLSNRGMDRETAVLIPVVEVLQISEVPETESEQVNQGVLRTKNMDEVEQTLEVELTPITRSRRQQIQTKDDTKETESPVTRHGRKQPIRSEDTEIVEEENVSPLKVVPKTRGRPKGSGAKVDTENVVPARARRGRAKNVTDEKNQKTTPISETAEISKDNSSNVTGNTKTRGLKKRTKAETESDVEIVENVSPKRKRISRHVNFEPALVATPVEAKRGRRGAKIKDSKEETEAQLPVKRGRNTRKKASEQEEVPPTMDTEQETSKPVKRGRNTRKKVQEGEEKIVETKENQGESQPTSKRGRRKQPAKETDENDINVTNVPAKPVRRARAAKVTKETENTEDDQEENTGKKTQRKRRPAKTETDDDVEESNDNSQKRSRKKAEDVKPVVKRTRKNVEVQGQEEPLRKSTRTRKVKS